MNIRETVRGVLRRVSEVLSTNLLARAFAGGGARATRRTAGAGSNLAPFLPDGAVFWPSSTAAGRTRTGAAAAHMAMPKPTAVNLRRFSETPVARRAINTIKDRIAGMRWRIQARSGRALGQIPDGALRIRALTENFEAPNPDDSFRSLLEQVLEDVIVGGFGAIEIDRVEGWSLPLDGRVLGEGGKTLEPQRAQRGTEEKLPSQTTHQSHPNVATKATVGWGTRGTQGPSTSLGFASAPVGMTGNGQLGAGTATQDGRTGVSALHGPLVMWPVDGATIRILPDWDGRADSPRYVQVTGLSGSGGQVVLNDDELSYIRLNPRTHTPFGLGRVEVAFETINAFLSAHRYASRLASNSVVQYALWLQDLTPTKHERLIRWWQDEIEGTGRVPIMSTEAKPEVLRFGAGTDADLRLAWQEFLLRVIADAFDLPAQFLGIERDVNRATASEMSEMAFRSAIVPTARLVAEYLTRDAIGKKLGWNDLEFVFTDVDATDEMQQAQIDEILLRNGVVTVNEVRRARGLAEIV